MANFFTVFNKSLIILIYNTYYEFYLKIFKFCERCNANVEPLTTLNEKQKDPYLGIFIAEITKIKNPFEDTPTAVDQINEENFIENLDRILTIIIKTLNNPLFWTTVKALLHCTSIREKISVNAEKEKAWKKIKNNNNALLAVLIEPVQYLPRFILLLEGITKASMPNQVQDTDSTITKIKNNKAIVGEKLEHIKKITEELNGQFKDLIAIYHILSTKKTALELKKKTDPVAQAKAQAKIAAFQKEMVTIETRIDALINPQQPLPGKTETKKETAKKMIKRMLEDPTITTKTGGILGLGESSTARELRDLLITIKPIKKVRILKKKIQLLEKKLQKSQASVATLKQKISSLEKKTISIITLETILKNYEKKKGFWRRYMPFIRAETQTISDLRLLLKNKIKNNITNVDEQQITDILQNRDDRNSKTRHSGVACAVSFFKKKTAAREKLSATDQAINELSTAFEQKASP
jgi:hypothetical protein